MAGRIDKAECRALRAKGWTLKALAERYGATRPGVSKACKGIVCGIDHGSVGSRAAIAKRIAKRDEKRARARVLFEAGYGPKDIAAQIECAVTSVYGYIGDLREQRNRVDVPAWVPSDLREIFQKVGRRRGEEVAASIVRRLKAEAAACR